MPKLCRTAQNVASGPETQLRPDFPTVYVQHWNLVCAYLYQRLPNHHTAEDLASETFAQAWLHWDSYVHEDRLKSWLFRIAHNTLVSYIRANRIAAREFGPVDPTSARATLDFNTARRS